MLLLNYYIKTKPTQIGHTLVEIYQNSTKIGEYIRNYRAFADETFYSFSLNGKEYALYSHNYNTISLMSLPDCKEIILKDECKNQLNNFCPTGIYIPMYSYNEEDNYQTQFNSLNEKEENEIYGYCNIGFICGCMWGDDTSDKLMLIDLRNIEEGELWYINNEFEKKWLYEVLPNIELKNIDIYFEDDGFTETFSGYPQPIIRARWFDLSE